MLAICRNAFHLKTKQPVGHLELVASAYFHPAEDSTPVEPEIGRSGAAIDPWS